MATRLKVFVTSDALTDYIVAASSRPKALAAGERIRISSRSAAHGRLTIRISWRRLRRDPGRCCGGRPIPKALATRSKHKAVKPKEPSPAALRKVADLKGQLADLRARRDQTLAENESVRIALEHRDVAVREGFEADEAQLSAALRAARSALD